MQSNFWAGSKNWDRHRNILGPVKGQGITLICNHIIGVLLGILLRITVRILLIKAATFANCNTLEIIKYGQQFTSLKLFENYFH